MRKKIEEMRSASRRSLFSIIAAAAALSATASAASMALAAERSTGHSYADGDVVTLMLPVPPGGGFDAQARLFAPYFEKHLKEVSGADVTVQVESKPGGGHLVAMQHVQNLEPDAKTVGYFNLGTAIARRVIDKEDLEPRKYTPLGTLVQTSRGFLGRADFPVPQDLNALAKRSKEQSILIAHTGAEAALRIAFGIWAENGLEIDVDYVEFNGSADTVAALLRGDVELGYSTTSGYTGYIEDNPDDLKMYMHGGCERSPLAPDTPTIIELGAPQADVVCDAVFSDYRTFFGPPGMNEADAAVLSQALKAAVRDPELNEQFEKALGLEPYWRDPEDLRKLTNQVVDTWEKYAHFALGD